MKGSCEVCKENPAKYRCPGCEVLTCCLACVKQHKISEDCTGQRDKAAYVSKDQFKDIHLSNDYRFLEDGGRLTNNCKRDSFSRRSFVPQFLKDLQKNASQRKIDLRLMPYPMTRRKKNYSTYQFKSKCILWQIEWKFPQADVKITDRRIPDTSTLDEVLSQHFEESADPITRHKLRSYSEAGREHWGLFMEVQNRPRTEKRYHRLNLDKTVTENLANKCVIEFPTIEVVLQAHWSDFITVLDDDQETSTVSPGGDEEKEEDQLKQTPVEVVTVKQECI